MATTSEDILEQLLSLPVETRARLAEQLLESLEPPNERNRRLWAKPNDDSTLMNAEI